MKALLAYLSLAGMAGASLAWAVPAPLPAQAVPDEAATAAPEPADPALASVLGYVTDQSTRMTVPVNIDGKGPYRFVVDTGSERTVIARELAGRLELDDGNRTVMHSMSEVSEVRTVVIPELEVAGKTVRRIHAPALAQHNLGAEGMLGVDTLQSQRVSFDFARQQMTITPSARKEERWKGDTIIVRARSRFGHLVLVDANVDGQKVWVILDTGSQATVGNEALRKRLRSKRLLGHESPVKLISVTGGEIAAQQTVARKIRVGGAEISDLPIAFADVHPFRKLDLMHRPALLLGMDALKLFDRVSVDFANRKVRLLLPGNSSRNDIRMANWRAPQKVG